MQFLSVTKLASFTLVLSRHCSTKKDISYFTGSHRTANAHSSCDEAQGGEAVVGNVLRVAQEPAMFYACVAIGKSRFGETVLYHIQSQCAVSAICVSVMRKIAVCLLDRQEKCFCLRNFCIVQLARK